ncbi:MAG: hypothetical protein E7454_04870 [Ruminococcaceae bacterium]|nr:hypothetical protein [Oscillospiraceae bacterium]
MIKGISVCNPVDIEREYLMFTVDYAKKMGFDHLQIIGPIHDHIKGNIEGITPFRKYSQFNDEKDEAYMQMNLRVVNEACKKASEYGIKTYFWHHELAMPSRFKEVYPEILNDYQDVEITHPLVKDFLENKIQDFFCAYPYFDGIILTLHETQIPLLKLKNQKLGKIERVQYVTQILYDSCKALGKELIVRPFASIAEDYEMMTAAYEKISTDLMIMDKWTQFDWSLTMPSNSFFSKIKKNPLFVEADIFGEFFGKGHLPLLLKDHISEKFRYCGEFAPAGYVGRIDRGGGIPFGDVNEVNLHLFHAALNQSSMDEAMDAFFKEKYKDAAEEVKALMLPTEEILKKTIYTNKYYFTELSHFPTLNHCKNHFYFEMMTKDCILASNEWFIPKNWNRGSIESLIAEKEDAKLQAQRLFEDLQKLEGRMDTEEYRKLWVKFLNLKLVTALWQELLLAFVNYTAYFETRDAAYERALNQALDEMLSLNEIGVGKLGNRFYGSLFMLAGASKPQSKVVPFVEEMRRCFAIEKAEAQRFEKNTNVLDYIVCGGAMEGHKLMKEVNFSDTLERSGSLCRIPGNRNGMQWSRINAHGWFSYEIAVTPHCQNIIKVEMEGNGGKIDCKITLGDQETVISREAAGKEEFVFTYDETAGNETVRIRFDKISGYVPCIFTVCSMKP